MENSQCEEMNTWPCLLLSICCFAQEEEMGPRIKTALFFDEMCDITPEQLAQVREIHVEGDLGSEVIQTRKPIHFATLNALKKRVCRSYSDQGYTDVKVELKAPDLEAGILRLIVVSSMD